MSLTVVILFCTSYAKVYAVSSLKTFASCGAVRHEKAFGSLHVPCLTHYQRGSKNVLTDSQKEEREYARWKIKKVNGIYYYKNKRIRIFMDSDKKTALDTFCYDKKGEVDLEIIRNKNHSIKKVKFISKKKAKKILKKLNIVYVK